MFIRADGSPKHAMCATISGAVLNTILDPVFLFLFDMGMDWLSNLLRRRTFVTSDVNCSVALHVVLQYTVRPAEPFHFVLLPGGRSIFFADTLDFLLPGGGVGKRKGFLFSSILTDSFQKFLISSCLIRFVDHTIIKTAIPRIMTQTPQPVAAVIIFR